MSNEELISDYKDQIDMLNLKISSLEVKNKLSLEEYNKIKRLAYSYFKFLRQHHYGSQRGLIVMTKLELSDMYSSLKIKIQYRIVTKGGSTWTNYITVFCNNHKTLKATLHGQIRGNFGKLKSMKLSKFKSELLTRILN